MLMKKLYLCFILLSSYSFAQIPANYYDTATGSGYTLKTQLYNIVSTGHVDQGYGALYTAYQTTHTDSYYENDGSVLDFYSENPAGTDSYFYTHGNNQCGSYNSENDCYNREHLMPQSIYSEAYPMRSDVHHVIPSDGYVNNRRGSYPFGEVSSPSWTSNNGSKVGSNTFGSYTGTVFEPIDEFKGDIARALLYFAVRYETQVASWSHAMLNGTSDQVYEDWFLDLLIDWHTNDPVVQAEVDRNNAAYNFQGNANPFVDHPEFVNMIWNPNPDTQDPTAPTNLVASNPTSSTIDLSWTASTDNVGVDSYDIYVGGVNTYNTTNTTFTATGLASETNFCFTVYAKDAAGNVSTVSNQDCEMTLASGGGGTDLYFSEYIEGSSYNKALEIANFTGSPVDLSDYSIRRDGNGGGSWDSGITLSGTLADGDVYVIANASINAGCASGGTIDLSIPQNNSPTNFNGNDPIGLFKSGTLIDIIGTFGGGSGNFAQNTTLVRNSNIGSPNTTFTMSEWTSYTSDTCSFLGAHTQDALSNNEFDLKKVSISPNPVKTGKININTSEELQLEIYDVLGKLVQTKLITHDSKTVNVSNLNKGVYLVRLSNNMQRVTKKLIIQ